MINMDFLRRYWGRAVDIVPSNREKNETFVTLTNGTCVCIICKETLPQLPQDKRRAGQKDHMRTYMHMKTLGTVEKNGICVVHTAKGWQLYCRICKKHLRAKETIKEHILDVNHDEWFKQMQDLTINETELLTTCTISIDKYLRSESNFALCEVCQEDLECTPRKVQEHIASESHRKLFLEALLPCTGLFPIENNNKMWCKICDLRLENKIEVLLEHLTDNLPHGRWFHDVDLLSVQDISVKDYLTDEKELMAKCVRCDLKIKAVARNIQAHVHSESHRLRYRNYSLGSVKSLVLQGIWPSWCHWNFFTHPALGDFTFWPS